jgi:hypothetical protein
VVPTRRIIGTTKLEITFERSKPRLASASR